MEGVNGTHDLEENFEELHPQRPRQYPTSLVIPVSSILDMGGELNSNGVHEPSSETFCVPSGGDTWLYSLLRLLTRTDPDNLYAVLARSPSGQDLCWYVIHHAINCLFDLIPIHLP